MTPTDDANLDRSTRFGSNENARAARDQLAMAQAEIGGRPRTMEQQQAERARLLGGQEAGVQREFHIEAVEHARDMASSVVVRLSCHPPVVGWRMIQARGRQEKMVD